MVKVADESPEEIARETRLSKLAVIAKDFLPHATSVHSWGGYYIMIHFDDTGQSKIDIYLNENVMNVKSQRYLDYAVKLAENYERLGEPEFTVKRRYPSS